MKKIEIAILRAESDVASLRASVASQADSIVEAALAMKADVERGSKPGVSRLTPDSLARFYENLEVLEQMQKNLETLRELFEDQG